MIVHALIQNEVVIHLIRQGKNLSNRFGNRLTVFGIEKVLIGVNLHGVLVNTHLAMLKHLVIVITETGDAVDGLADALQGVL